MCFIDEMLYAEETYTSHMAELKADYLNETDLLAQLAKAKENAETAAALNPSLAFARNSP